LAVTFLALALALVQHGPSGQQDAPAAQQSSQQGLPGKQHSEPG
jgi:hypothetical protein